MQTLEKAFVLSSLKYSETSLIINAYTEKSGRRAFIHKGFFKRKKQGNYLISFLEDYLF